MNGMDGILCKTDLILIRRHTYKRNTFSDVDFEALCTFVVFTISIKECFERGGFILCDDLDLIWFLPELNTPHQLSLFFWARISRQPYVGHDNLKVKLWVYSHYKVPWTFYIYENHQENIA